MKPLTKKAVAYIRVSDVRQLDGESPETQREKIAQYAEANDIEILESFFDEGKSAKNAAREELHNLLDFAKRYKGKIDHVLVYKMSRASRDLESYYSVIKAVLKRKGITIRSVTEPMIDDSSQGRFMEGLFVLLAQLDNDGKSETTIDNMKSLAEQGYWQHPPLLGYKNCKILNSLGKPRPSLQPDSKALKVKMVLERYSQGDISKAELTRYSAEIGLTSCNGKKLGEDSINRLIKKDVYAGFISDRFTNYESVPGKHEAIISVHTYEKNLALLYSKNTRKNEVHLRRNKDYPLKGSVLCSGCLQALYASAPKTGNGSYSPRYHCARVSCRGKVKSVKASIVHDDFVGLLKTIKPTEGILRLYKTILVREAGLGLESLNHRLEKLREDLSQIDQSRVSAIRKFAEDAITVEEKIELTDLLDGKKLKIIENIDDLERLQSVKEGDIDLAIDVMMSVDKQWSNSDLDIQMKFQSMLFPEGLIYDSDNHRFGTSTISPLYRCVANKKTPEGVLESHLVAGAGLEPATLWL